MLAEADDLVIPNIFLLDYDATKLGELRVCFGSFVWTRYGGNRLKIVVDLSVVTDVTWTKGWWCQLSLRLQDGSNLKFLGFLEQDAGCLNKLFPNTVKVAALENQMPLTVRNCIELGLNGLIMTFLLGSEQSCEISLSHLAAVHLIRKNCAELETPEERNLMYEIKEGEKVTVEEDFLRTMKFYMPHCDGRFLRYPSSQCFHDKCMEMVDASRFSRRDAIAMFRRVAVVSEGLNASETVELHHRSLRFSGQYRGAHSEEIKYASISQIFAIPEWQSGSVVLEVEKSSNTGPTYFPFLFGSKDVVNLHLQMTEEDIAEYGGRLKASYEGPLHEIFIDILAGLAGTKVSGRGCVNDSAGGCGISANLFFFPTRLYLKEKFLISEKHQTFIFPYNEIESVNFRLHGGGKDIVSFDNSEACKDGNRFFDMSLQMKAGEKNVFMNIRVEEYQNLLKHLKEKQLEVNDMDSKFDGVQITSGLGSFSEPKKEALSGLVDAVQSTCTIYSHNPSKRLERLCSYWKGCKNGVWSHIDVLAVVVSEVPDTKSSAFSRWLLGHQCAGMVMLFSEFLKKTIFVCPNDHLDVMETFIDSVGKAIIGDMRITLERVVSSRLQSPYDALDAMQVQPALRSLVVGYNALEAPKVGYLCTWTEKLEEKFKICEIADGLSELFSVKDDVALAHIKATSLVVSSVMWNFALPETVHMFRRGVAPHSEIIEDMVDFIHYAAEVAGIKKENVDIHGGRPVFQSGCWFGLDDLSLPMDNWDLECRKTGVIISSVGLCCNGYWSNMSRTILIHPNMKQVLALQTLVKAQKAAIRVLRPGNKVSAAYQEAVGVVSKEAPEFATHLTKSAGCSIGLEFCESRLSLDAENEHVLEVGMVFSVSLGFENLRVDTGDLLTEKFSMLIADTVVIKEESTEALTEFSHCLIGTEEVECLKVINVIEYEAEYPKIHRYYEARYDLLVDDVDCNTEGDSHDRLIQVDDRMEAVFLPLFRSMVPFHISCIRRFDCYPGEQEGHYYLDITLNTDNEKKTQLGPNTPSYLQHMMFYLMSPGGVREICTRIRALQLKHALREARTRRAKQVVAGNAMLTQQDTENVGAENHPFKKRRLSA